MYNLKYLINEIDCIGYYLKKKPNQKKIIKNYLEELKESNKNTTLNILETLINKYFFKILQDNCLNDVRKVELINNNNYKINILSTFIIDEYTSKIKEYIEISFNNNLYKL